MKEKEKKNDDTTIIIKMSTRDRLKTFGNMGDTYDTLLNKLMDASEPR